MSLIDKCTLKKYSPTTSILTMDKPMKVKGLGDKQYDASTFLILDILMPGSNNTTPHIRRQFHIVENLDAKILLGIDIASPEGWSIDMENEKLVMPHCQGISVPISTKFRAPISITRVFATSKTGVPPHSRKLIKVGNKDGPKINLPVHDMLYEPIAQDVVKYFPQVVSRECNWVLVQNDSSTEIIIPTHHVMGELVDTEVDLMTRVSETEVYHLMPAPLKKAAWSRILMKEALVAATSSAWTIIEDPKESSTNKRYESVLPSGVTVFGDNHQQQSMTRLVDEFQIIWTDRGRFAKPPHNEN
ncbi:hypothetical protein K3495_g606 [Podosphaera aphanis]|nr:hypothetical protein K3495_g606 [Podosphaera aphanis]